ncbi:MAG: PAS domain S-box protein [Deltaproteobacteria bacterium]|nr:PAS domain S-box protein [Deltaproteobacteria bacterium]
MNMYQTVIDTFDDLYCTLTIPTFLFNDKGALVKANKSFCDLTGITAENIASYELPGLLKIFKNGVWSLAGLLDNHITELTDRAGHTFPVMANYKKLNTAENIYGGGLGFITSLQEIEATRLHLRELTIAHEALQEQTSGTLPDTSSLERKRLEHNLQETNDYLENVIESCGDGIVIIDGSGKITRANGFFAALMGRDKKDIQGAYIYDFVPSVGRYQSTTGETVTLDRSYIEYQLEVLHQIFLTGDHASVGNWEWYGLHADGRVVPFEAMATFQKNEAGVTIRGVVVVRDITERKKSEKDLTDAKDFLENMLESCGDGIFIVDDSGTITRTNEAFCTMLGKSRPAIEGRPIYDIGPLEGTYRSTAGETVVLDRAHREAHMRRLEKTFSQHGDDFTVENFEYHAFHASGDIVPLELTITFQLNPQGSIARGICSARNITERKKSERDLRDAFDFQKRFFTNITHEFRTPLTLAIGPLEGVLRGEYGDMTTTMREQLDIGLRNSRQLLRLVNQLLDFSRLESGAQPVALVTKDLKQFIGTVLDSFSIVAQQRNIKLTFAPTGDLAPVAIDPAKLEKILFNLIGNAFKFTPPQGTVTITVSMAATAELPATEKDGPCPAGAVRIAVADTGPGIKKEDFALIFERFRQADDSRTRDFSGTGIGLAYARELVTLMGGTIQVRSDYGSGATFSVLLPVIPQPAAGAFSLHGSALEETTTIPEIELADINIANAELSDSVSGEKPLVLIVDDNQDVLRYVAEIIRKNHDFMTAESGRHALERMASQTPDLILCDVMMPGMDGYELLQHVKTDSALQSVPFIFLTAQADTRLKIEGLEKGADDYIVKPFNSLELLARIRAQLRIRDLMSQTEQQQDRIDTLTQKLQVKYRYGNIVGNSPSMRKIYQMIDAVKKSDASVLLTGETGTGKELIANAIHYNSPRKNGPLVSVNCGAIPRELMEREFFGHVKGAYTGAVDSRKGYFQEAHSGTLFLDEIGELDMDMQVKLLRVLERGEIMRVGESKPITVDVRIITATNKNLLAEVQEAGFREDLYYRIHVIPIHLPPLRQRTEDIPFLIEHFLQEFSSGNSSTPASLTERQLRPFLSYQYPGNIRELRHLVERFCLLGGKTTDLFTTSQTQSGPAAVQAPGDEIFSAPKPLKAAGLRAKANAEKSILAKALELCNNDYPQTAKKLNICLASLYNKINEYGLK